MTKLVLGLTVALAACGGDDSTMVKLPDSNVALACSPTEQTGCAVNQKCTWMIDAVMGSNVVGHTGCAPDGSADIGAACSFGAPGETGYDNCKKGTVCSDFRQDHMEPHPVCKSICDQQDAASCGSGKYCFTYRSLFGTGDTTPSAGGICEDACDPFADNDFDGSGTYSMKTGGKCDADLRIGCYGSISNGSGTGPTKFACIRDKQFDTQQPAGLRHRAACTVDNHCQAPGPVTLTNGCNQGYQPLLKESTMVSTATCVALCKPHNCYLGNCGSNDAFRVGDAPNRCANPDRVGEFFHDGAPTHENGEHCRFLWRIEAGSNGFIKSDYSNTVGYCEDHTKYQYDSDNDGTADTNLPPCASVPITGSGTAPSDPGYWSAARLGCVDTATAGMTGATGKAVLEDVIRAQRAADFPRPLYGSPAR